MRNQRAPKDEKVFRNKSKPYPISFCSLLTLMLLSFHHHMLKTMALSTCGIHFFLNIPRCGGTMLVCNATAASSTITSEASSGYGNANGPALRAARAINSIAFLKHLVRQKNTSDERYFRHSIRKPVGVVDPDLENDNLMETIQPLEIMTSCQYNGILWFLPKMVKFQESIRIVDVSPCGQSATLECLTQYQTRKEDWVDCSRVTCTIQPPALTHQSASLSKKETSSVNNMEMKVTSEILVKIPMVGIANKAIKRKIGKTFEIAVGEYLNQMNVLSDDH